MVDNILKKFEIRMHKRLDVLFSKLSTLKVGRAHPDLLSSLKIDYFGSFVSVFQVSNVSILDSRTLSIVPWDNKMISKIEKSILVSKLGINPINLGNSIKLPIPLLTEYRRKEIVKLIHHDREDCCISLRNIRREANLDIRGLLKKNIFSKDIGKSLEIKIQKLTDSMMKKINIIINKKKQDLMEI